MRTTGTTGTCVQRARVWVWLPFCRLTMKRVLVIVTGFLWIVQGALPLLDSHVPKLFSLPLSEILSLVLGLVVVLCGHALLSTTHMTQGQLGFGTNMAFLVLSGLWTAGLGIHVSAVVILSQITPENSLYPLVQHHLHRLWSHNMFQLGYYGLLLLIVLSEVRGYKQQSRVGSSEKREGPASACSVTESTTSYGRGFRVWAASIVDWIWLIIMGVDFTVLAINTDTLPITIAFFLVVLSSVWVMWVQGWCTIADVLWHSSRPDLHISGSVARSCVIGLLTVCIASVYYL